MELEVQCFRVNDKLQKRVAEHKKKYKEALKKIRKQKKIEVLERKKIRDSRNSNPKMERSLFQFPLRCSKCNKEMTSLGKVQSHLNEKRKCRSSQFKCSLCPKTFIWPFTLIRHFRQQHLGPEGKPKVNERKWIFCRFCKKAFLSKQSLNIHLNKCHGCLAESIQPKSKIIKPKKQCRKQETSANKDSKNLKPEKRCHKQGTSANKDSIPIAKTGSTSAQSDSSNSNHEMERSFIELPLTCSKCKYKMTSLSKVQSHLNTNPKCRFSQFKCKFCPKIFIWPGTLIKHFREQHQGIGGTTRVIEREWNFCKVCQKPFLSKKALNTHQNKFHGYLTDSNQPTSKKVKPDKRGHKQKISANKDSKNLKPEKRCHKQETSADKDSIPIAKKGSNSSQSAFSSSSDSKSGSLISEYICSTFLNVKRKFKKQKLAK